MAGSLRQVFMCWKTLKVMTMYPTGTFPLRTPTQSGNAAAYLARVASSLQRHLLLHAEQSKALLLGSAFTLKAFLNCSDFIFQSLKSKACGLIFNMVRKCS